jgi:hypothetical protein
MDSTIMPPTIAKTRENVDSTAIRMAERRVKMAKKNAMWANFGTIGFEAYITWVLENQK